MPSLIFNRADIEYRLADTLERIRTIETRNTEQRANKAPITDGISLHNLRLKADTYIRLLGGSGSSVQFAPR